MKKIAVVTIVDYNFGNRLQNYAVQEIYKTCGLQPETICLQKSLLTEFKYFFRDLIRHDMIYRYRQFNKLINWSGYSFSDDYSNAYDYYSIGSDQVWNAEWFDEYPYRKDNFLLSFVAPEKRICMAPSFGISLLPEKWVPFFRGQLSKFPKLAVREQSGADLIRELTGREAKVVIDPTLMLEASRWAEIAESPKKIDISQPFILTYFLGNQTDRNRKQISLLAKKNNYAVINVMDSSMRKTDIGPSEFLYLIKNARTIMTDSFHACVFSFLFGRPFVVYKREGDEENLGSRIDTLLKRFDLENRRQELLQENDYFVCDYTVGYQKLERERSDFMQFIIDSLK